MSKSSLTSTPTPRIGGGMKRIESQNASSCMREAWREPIVERLMEGRIRWEGVQLGGMEWGCGAVWCGWNALVLQD